METQRNPQPGSTTASLEHLTGPSRGSISWLGGEQLTIELGSRLLLHISSEEEIDHGTRPIARLHQAGTTYRIEALENEALWVNGRPVSEKQLHSGDMIEFGERGPLSRFHLYQERGVIRHNLAEVLGDAADYLRVSRQPLPVRIYRALCQVLRRLARETTLLFRVGVVAAIGILAGLVYQQYRLSELIQTQLERGESQLDTFARALARARQEALTPGDLEALRQEISPSVEAHEKRLADLEHRTGASARVISNSASSVVFLQGAYGYKETASGRMLRHLANEDGQPVMSPFGQPLFTLDGDGPVAERQLTGTGFLVARTDVLVTNRHVAIPWKTDSDFQALAKRGLEPVMINFVAYFPSDPEARPVILLQASESVDLALARAADMPATASGLPFADVPPKPGEDVIIIGYPTGLRSLLAQAGEAFIRRLQEAKIAGFWELAAFLAANKRIAPLASQGIVGQVSSETIVYDAQTTHGGSGAPVLNTKGQVIAVNTAIIPKFGGSNLGVPVAKVKALLRESGIVQKD